MTVTPITKPPVPTSQSIGAQIAKAIDARKIKQTRVAADIEVSEATLRRFIAGTSDPSFLQILRLSEILDYPIGWFVEAAAA